MGSKGALFMDANRCLLAEPLAIEVQSTVGAGDAMVAGILAAQLQGLDLVGCVQLATAFAAGTLEGLGPHLPEREKILAMAKRVQSCKYIIGE
jgi:fructose-1-phosphate kinase PfkB-like protein